MRVFLWGMPAHFGGAMVEAGDTALLWRPGIEVTCLILNTCHCGGPQLWPHEEPAWERRLTDAGVEFVYADCGRLGEVQGLAGSPVVAFCSRHFLHNWSELASLGCYCVWSPCMCYTAPEETAAFRDVPPSIVHVQSEYQESQIRADYESWGCHQFFRCRGAFDPLPFRPRAHKSGERFIVGRLARANRTKWNPHLWYMLQRARDTGLDLEVLCQAWSDEVLEKVGPPPPWAICYKDGANTAEEFLARCHAMICPNWTAKENWPRVGLEAMSVGVPLIVDDAGGWREMCGDAAIYCDKDDFGAYGRAIKLLAGDEMYRQRLTWCGRQRVREVADASDIGRAWTSLFKAQQILARAA